ncbi:MAG: energy-coupling factor transporter ATPase [Actinobacteria bacterium]|nr:energy-coupling factor transporter ATPase [Actinomycetota bacterium]
MSEVLLQYENISFQYKNGSRPAVEDIGLDVREGEVVLITGPSGAGKTTICRAGNGLIPHLYTGEYKNKVIVAGRYDTKEYDVAALSKIVGLLFQDPDTQLFSPTVEEEIGFGAANYGLPREEIVRRVEELLDLTRLTWARRKNPHRLSGGQQQAVALASVLATNPKILILDEPTSNIDPIGSQQILELVAELARKQGRTLVVVEHKIEEVANIADHMVVMDGGRIIRSGPPRKVLDDVELIHDLGLHAPEVALLCQRLRNAGYSIGELPLTLEEAYGVLEPLLPPPPIRARLLRPATKRTLSSTGEIILEIHDVTHRYPDGTTALDGVTLQIRRGEFVAVLGQNGSGKTTLMKHLNGLLKPTSGRVLVAGKDTQKHSIGELSAIVGYIFQDPSAQIFKMKVCDEIAFGPQNLNLSMSEVEGRVRDAAKQLDIEHLLNENPFFLSKGEKQRVAVAAVMAMKPQVLVLDEPTTGQDYRRSRDILELCVELNRQGTTILMITHDMKLAAEYAGRVVVMKGGRILADGNVRDVFGMSDVLRDSFLKPPQVCQLGFRLGLPYALLTVDEAEAALKSLASEVA